MDSKGMIKDLFKNNFVNKLFDYQNDIHKYMQKRSKLRLLSFVSVLSYVE